MSDNEEKEISPVKKYAVNIAGMILFLTIFGGIAYYGIKHKFFLRLVDAQPAIAIMNRIFKFFNNLMSYFINLKFAEFFLS